MRSLSRRDALLAGTTSLLALAGCTGSDRSVSDSHRDRKPVAYEATHVRLESGDPIVRPPESLGTPANPAQVRGHSEYVATATELAAVRFAANPAASELKSVAAETDFETASVFLFSTGVSECHEIHLRAATVQADGDPHLDFCRAERPADVACSGDVMHTVGYAVRLAIDGTRASGHGSGMSSHCRNPPSVSVFDETVTVQSGEDP
jgi:hypothetical protein